MTASHPIVAGRTWSWPRDSASNSSPGAYNLKHERGSEILLVVSIGNPSPVCSLPTNRCQLIRTVRDGRGMKESEWIVAAGNGLFDRRFFLKAGVAGSTLMLATAGNGQDREPWMRVPGAALSESGDPSTHEAHVKRIGIAARKGTTGSGVSRTPLEYLDGIITPSRLHFERHHSGIPEIDPAAHRLTIHGLVERPLSFDVDALARYPISSNIQFLECSGNSYPMLSETPAQGSCGEIHGLISVSEWGGVPLSILLDEAGLKPNAKWIIADGADAAIMNRSVPLEKALDDAIVAVYQNGEKLRPSNGYPMRLFLPGWEGNASIKWLRTIKVAEDPAWTREETSKYSDLQNDGTAYMFTFLMGVKSVITTPSPGLHLREPGVYRISGLAWSGAGKIARVDVSADAGRSWAEAALDSTSLSKCATRFRAAWRWDGGPAVLMSRALDDHGNVQPTRDEIRKKRANGTIYHVNAIQAWQVNEDGTVRNVHA
jgi:sulfane dehydrogenase subunit SoxC